MNKNKKKCYILGAGDFEKESFLPEDGDYIIAADGGYLFLKKLGLKADLIIGDFDSMDESEFLAEELKHLGTVISKLPKEKNDTDLLAAIRAGIEQNCEEFHIFGGTGGRIDHTIANMQCLTFLSKMGKKGYLYGTDYKMTTVTDGKLYFSEKEKGYLGVFSMGDMAEGVYLEGLKYPLVNATITNDYPIGVSNEFMNQRSSVEVRKGTLLVITYLSC